MKSYLTGFIIKVVLQARLHLLSTNTETQKSGLFFLFGLNKGSNFSLTYIRYIWYMVKSWNEQLYNTIDFFVLCGGFSSQNQLTFKTH